MSTPSQPSTTGHHDTDTETNNNNPLRPIHLLEQYQLYVEIADRTTRRREAANRFYAALTTIAAVLFGVLVLDQIAIPASRHLQALTIQALTIQALTILATGSLFAAALSAVWLLNNNSYQQLHQAQRQVIKNLEQHLPVAGYSEESTDLAQNPGRQLNLLAKLAKIEHYVPVCYASLFLTIAAYAGYQAWKLIG